MGVARSNLYEQLRLKQAKCAVTDIEPENLSDLAQVVKKYVDEKPTYGYRRITALIRRHSHIKVNHKRIYRVMKNHAWLLQRYTPRPARTHTGKVITARSNTRWCTDAFGIQCWNGEQLQVAFSLDCCDREVMSWVTSTRGIDGGLVRDLMTETVEKRFPGAVIVPHRLQWLSDNGPGYTARQTVYHGRMLGFEVCTTPAYSPESNGMAEAFVKTFKRDYIYVNDLRSADHVRLQLARWFSDYNENAPHKGLQMRSPREYLRGTNSAA